MCQQQTAQHQHLWTIHLPALTTPIRLPQPNFRMRLINSSRGSENGTQREAVLNQKGRTLLSDPTLSYIPHLTTIEYLLSLMQGIPYTLTRNSYGENTSREEMKHRFHLIRWSPNPRNKLSLENKRLRYLSIIRLIWTYAAPIWGFTLIQQRVQKEAVAHKNGHRTISPWLLQAF